MYRLIGGHWEKLVKKQNKKKLMDVNVIMRAITPLLVLQCFKTVLLGSL